MRGDEVRGGFRKGHILHGCHQAWLSRVWGINNLARKDSLALMWLGVKNMIGTQFSVSTLANIYRVSATRQVQLLCVWHLHSWLFKMTVDGVLWYPHFTDKGNESQGCSINFSVRKGQFVKVKNWELASLTSKFAFSLPASCWPHSLLRPGPGGDVLCRPALPFPPAACTSHASSERSLSGQGGCVWCSEVCLVSPFCKVFATQL